MAEPRWPPKRTHRYACTRTHAHTYREGERLRSLRQQKRQGHCVRRREEAGVGCPKGAPAALHSLQQFDGQPCGHASDSALASEHRRYHPPVASFTHFQLSGNEKTYLRSKRVSEGFDCPLHGKFRCNTIPRETIPDGYHTIHVECGSLLTSIAFFATFAGCWLQKKYPETVGNSLWIACHTCSIAPKTTNICC